MSWLFRVRRWGDNGDGTGGKILRGRRAPPSDSPYHRREKSLPPPPPPDGQSGNSTWFSGTISGVGKFVSSVLSQSNGDSSPSSSSSYSYSSDGDSAPNSNKDEDTDVSSKEPDEVKQIEKKSEQYKGCIGRSLAIVSEIEPKQAVEQLLMQETFSRDECNKLINIIQSRVVDYPSVEVGDDGIHKELPDRTTDNAVAFAGACKSLNQARKLPETISYSFSSLNAMSPGSYSCQVLTPELHNSAVMEAKRWLEDKKLMCSSKADLDSSPCNRNTNMLQYDFEGEVGSPIDMAKSYMRSLTPWKSPPLSSTRFEKTPQTGMHLYKDEAPYATSNYSLSPSSKRFKRNYHALGSQDILDDTRRVRLKSLENASDSCKFKLSDLSVRDSGLEACKISSVADEHTYHDLSNLPARESLDASANMSAELCATDYGLVGALRLSGETADEENHPAGIGNTISLNLISDTEKAVNVVQSAHGTSSLTSFTLRPNFAIEIGQLSYPSVLILDKNQDAEKPSHVKEQPGSFSAPCDSLILAPSSVEHDEPGEHLENILNSETKIMPSAVINSAASDIEAVTNLNDITTSSMELSCVVGNNSFNQKLVPGVKELHSIADPKLPYWNGTQNEAKGLIFFTNGSSTELNRNLDVASQEDHNPTNSSNSERAPGISEATYELPRDGTTNLPLSKTINSIKARSRGGTKMESVKDVLTEPQPSPSRGRGRKPVPRPKSGSVLIEPQPSTSRGRGRKAVPRPKRGRGR